MSVFDPNNRNAPPPVLTSAGNQPPPPSQMPVVRNMIEVPWRTIARILMVFAGLWVVDRLFSVILTFVIALFLTAALAPAVSWLKGRGLKHGTAVLITVLGFVIITLGTLALLLQPLINEGRDIVTNLPQYVEDIGGRFQTRYPEIYDNVQSSASNLSADSVPLDGIVSIATGLVSTVTNSILVLAMTAYLLADGKRIYNWAVRYLPDDQEAKVHRAIPEVSRMVSGYVVGQLATSVAFGIFSFSVLTIVGVPQATFLAVFAAILDAVPLVGAFIATVPAVLLALTVSPKAAIITLVLYLVYQQFENYVLAPRVYRGTMQISSFAVLIAVLIGSQLLGVVGALLALPIAAAIPVLEQIWILEPLRARRPATPPGFGPVSPEG